MYKSFAKHPSTIDIVEIMGLAEHNAKRVSELSGGWKRRLTIAAAFMTDSQILILDEITSGVDVVARNELWEIIKALSKNKTIIATTHTLFEAEKYFDRTAFLVNGRLVCLGANEELVKRFGNRIYLEVRSNAATDIVSLLYK